MENLFPADQNPVPDPVGLFKKWYDHVNPENTDEFSAMCLSTVGSDCRPSARMVLLRGFDEKGFRFFTNYSSRKASEIAANPNVALVFSWFPFRLQVRIEGIIEKLPEKESEEYFARRYRASRISAWASNQSREILNRKELEEKYRFFESKFGEGNIPKPPFWGGYLVVPNTFEFWEGQENRLHNRLLYSMEKNGTWKIRRLQP